jgi:hypothetical protein
MYGRLKAGTMFSKWQNTHILDLTRVVQGGSGNTVTLSGTRRKQTIVSGVFIGRHIIYSVYLNSRITYPKMLLFFIIPSQ